MATNFHIGVQWVGNEYIIEIQSALVKPPLVHRQSVKDLTMDSMVHVYFTALSIWEYKYGIGAKEHPFGMTRGEIYTDMVLHNFEGPNWLKVNPPFRRGAREQALDKPDLGTWYGDILKDVDMARFPTVDRSYFQKFVWLDSSLRTGVPPLYALVMRRLSLFNYTQSDSEGPLAVASTTNLRPYKLPLLVRKYAQPVHKGLLDPALRRGIVNGIQVLNSVMGVNKFYGRVWYKYDVEDLLKTPFPGGSSSGLRKGRSEHVVEEGLRVRRVVNGLKRVQAPYAFSVADQYINAWKSGLEPEYPERCCKCAFKYEVYDAMWTFGEDRKKKYLKCREFFITHFVDFIISVQCQGFRVLLERGNTICIGLKWWYGGAHTFVTELGYGRKGVKYFGGDIRGQDYTTRHFLLQFFMISALVYFDRRSPDYKWFKKMVYQNADYIVAKLVNFFGDMWRFIIGTMPSGHFVTSHGNSWIFAVLWWAYVFGVHERNPRAKILVRVTDGWEIGKKYFIRFKVYGDNHNVALCEESRLYLDYNDFVAYMADIGITIHDIQYDVPLISQIDSMGNLRVIGLVFLKRYFIETIMDGKKYVIPYKRFMDTALKIVYGNSMRKNEYDVLLALNGLAWDTMGTNVYTYKVLLQIYEAVSMRVRVLNLAPLEVYLRTYDPSGTELEKRAKKIGIPVQDFFRFPSRKELAMRHVFIPSEHYYRKVPSMRGCLWSDELEGETYANEYPAG